MHKSQGLTFSHVTIDLTGGVFCRGQTYVALSRCTSLEGIRLRKPISRSDVFVRPEIVQFSRRFNNRQAIDRAMRQAQADMQYAAAAKAFDRATSKPASPSSSRPYTRATTSRNLPPAGSYASS